LDEIPFEHSAIGELDTLARAKGFIDTLAEGIVLVDHAGSVVAGNRAASEILVVEPDVLVGANLFEAPLRATFEDGTPVPPDEHPVMDTLNTGATRSHEVIGLDLPTTRRWLMFDSSPYPVGGSPGGAVVKFVDITMQVWRQRNFEVLHRVNHIMVSAVDLPDFFQMLCVSSIELARCTLALISVSDADSPGGMRVLTSAGANDGILEAIQSWSLNPPSELGPTSVAMRTKTIQLVNVQDDASVAEPRWPLAERLGFNSLAATPFAYGDETGVLTLCSPHHHAFDELAARGLEVIAGEIEFAISHMRSVRELARALDGTLAALGQMTESRDPYTEGHQLGVGDLAAAIAARLGMDSRMVQLVRQSGEVHDIGKIVVPSEILTRPGRLTGPEFEIVKTHTLVGSDILSRASLPWPIATVALQHHERLDGSGYPYGLVGDAISLSARIIAVADVVEAMTKHRPYRPGLGLDEALAEVTRGVGTLFDAEVVRACLDIFNEGFTFPSHGGADDGDIMP